ncbi:MAG: A/G-specific adenine glycosylase [Verrucomicrobiota bacterium]|jgi:A/G-specific adenine glycosylase
MTSRTPNSHQLVPVLLDWFSENARDLPWRRTRDPYAIWVSEIMLQQTQVKTVIPYWKRWMRELPTVEAAANAGPDKIHKLWEGLGYYARARNLQKAAQQIVEAHRGEFPRNFGDVFALPGIGRYIAGAICSIAFNQPAPILDGNVIRVLTRMFGIDKNPREKKTNARLWRLAEELVAHVSQVTCHLSRSQSRTSRHRHTSPRQGTRTRDENEDDLACSHFNQSLMELGALVCTPRQPKCPDCPVKKLCVAFRENRVNELPNLGKRAPAAARRFVAVVLEQNGRFLVRQRPAGAVNAHLWEFPNVEVAAGSLPAVEPGVPPGGKNSGNDQSVKISRKIPAGRMPPSTASGTPAATRLASAVKNLGFDIRTAKPLCTVKHSITRYRITLEAFHVPLGGTSYTSPHPERARSGTRRARPSEMGIWRTPAQMHRLAFTAAHKKLASFATHRILSDR